MAKTFQVTSGKMVCSDPCYSIPTWCQGIVDNVKNGVWEAGIKESDEGAWGTRIAYLWVYNIEAVTKNPQILSDIETYHGSPMPFAGGVDSGQFGFFDFAHYRNDASAEGLPKSYFGDDYDRESGDAWYRACAELTLGEESWGELPHGVVSSSGFGDGSYGVVGIKDDEGQYVAFCVEFIGNDEDDEDDWEDGVDGSDDWGEEDNED